MSFLSKLLVKSITKTIKSTAKFELAVDDLIEKFKDSCPPKSELLKIVQQKNQIQTALQNVVDAFTSVQQTVDITDTLVSTVGGAVKIIKTLPFPVSVPPGVGIPVNVITILADSLDTLGDLLKGAKGALKIVPTASQSITSAAQSVITKLQSLDLVLNKCIEDLAENGGADGGPMTQEEKNELILEIGSVAATSGNTTNVQINTTNDQLLLNQLNPDSLNPFLYRRGSDKSYDWKLEIEYNADNEFAFPERRIKAININEDTKNVFRGVTIYNLQYGRWSYSTSVLVLIQEAQFRIDQLNVGWWRINNPNFSLQAADVSRDVGGTLGGDDSTVGGTPTTGSNNTTTTTTTTTTSTTPPIVITGQLNSIPIPTNLNNAIGSTRIGQVITTLPSQSISIFIDTGEIVPQYGTFNNNPFDDDETYAQGEINVKFWPNLGQGLPITYYAEQEYKTFTYVYNEPGEYNWKIMVNQFFNVLENSEAKVGIEPLS